MNRKYASFEHCGTYNHRITPFFDTVQEVERWESENQINTDDAYTHPVANWQEVIDWRNDYNTAPYIQVGQ